MTLNATRRRDRKRTRRQWAYLDGRLIPRTFYADGRRGVVRHWKVNAEGKLVREFNAKLGRFGPVVVESRGRVEWRPVA